LIIFFKNKTYTLLKWKFNFNSLYVGGWKGKEEIYKEWSFILIWIICFQILLFSFCTDLGGSSEYSNEKFEDWSGERFNGKIISPLISRF